VPPLDAGDPLAAPSYRAVDLETGTVARLLARDPALSYADPPELSPDGRFALVAAAGSAGARTWLLNAEAIDATELSGAEAHFSPDGCHVVVQAHDRGGSAVQVIPAGGERPRGSTSRMDIDMLAWVANASAQPNA
jgi:hypothetical protein